MHEEAAVILPCNSHDDKDGRRGEDYLYKRGLTDEVMKHFQIGLAPAERTYLYQRLADNY